MHTYDFAILCNCVIDQKVVAIPRAVFYDNNTILLFADLLLWLIYPDVSNPLQVSYSMVTTSTPRTHPLDDDTGNRVETSVKINRRHGLIRKTQNNTTTQESFNQFIIIILLYTGLLINTGPGTSYRLKLTNQQVIYAFRCPHDVKHCRLY